MPWGMLAGVAGSALGGLFGRSSAKQQQKATERAYQNRHQWEVEDLRKAGLNPVLSAMQSPGSVGPMSQAPTPSIDLPGASRSSTASALAKEQIATEKSEQAKNQQQESLLRAQTRAADVQALMDEQQLQWWQAGSPIARHLSTARAFREAGGGGVIPSATGAVVGAFGAPVEQLATGTAKGLRLFQNYVKQRKDQRK